MSWGKTRIFKVTVSLVLALGASVFVGEKVLIPGTMVVNPEVKRDIVALPEKAVQLPSKFADLLKRITFPGFPGLKKPFPSPVPTSPVPSQPPKPPPLPPGETPTPTPAVTPSPYHPPPTPIPTPMLTPRPTPTTTPTPSGVTLESFAKCLTSKGMKMYGVEGCGACQQQRNMFGPAFTYINYIDCNQQSQLCSQKGIIAYPTWEDGSGDLYRGTQSFSSLSQISGCQAPS